MSQRPTRPSPTTVIACLALFFAVAGGSAVALQGRNSVDSGDIKKNAVKSRQIAKNAVKASEIAANAVNGGKIRNGSVASGDIGDGAVGSGDIADGSVGSGDLTPTEPAHIVGTPGEPGFNNGVEGDCVWDDVTGALAPGYTTQLNPAHFYKDPYGMLHLGGLVRATATPGAGDGNCDTSGSEGVEDAIVFILPASHRPQNDSIVSVGNFFVQVVGVDPVTTPDGIVPAGAVAISTIGSAPLLTLDSVPPIRLGGPGTGLGRRAATGATRSGGRAAQSAVGILGVG